MLDHIPLAILGAESFAPVGERASGEQAIELGHEIGDVASAIDGCCKTRIGFELGPLRDVVEYRPVALRIDRIRVLAGQGVSVRVDSRGRRLLEQKTNISSRIRKTPNR